MSVERPTFSESWHRVAGARCRLRAGVRVVRQRYRGQTWHVAQDPAANQFFRLNEPAYRFVGLLDGKRSVAEAWRLTSARDGDEAPTQGEVVQLLGQMYTSNLLAGEVPGDAQAVFARGRKRLAREVRGQLANLLFLRIPLVDPDAFLTRWHRLFAWCFTPVGLALWLIVLAIGAAHLPGREKELASSFAGVLAPDNLFLLYVVFAFIKLVHELAHGFACKVFGVREAGERAGAGEVRTMGVMLMVLMPVPYVDASSSWALRSKWRRAIVASAGMMAELVVAAFAAVVWSRSSEGGLVHALAFNALVTASVSTVIFNGNPLLRYDGYYIFSELIEIPNLAQRSADYVRYLVKKHIWRVQRPVDPSTSPGERAWFIVYWPASLVYRIIVFAGIILFISQQWFIIGVIFAIVGLVTWLVVPAARYVRYLFTSGELARARGRAIGSSALTAGLLGAAIGLVPLPDHVRAEGVVEPINMEILHARSDGFVQSAIASGSLVEPSAPPLVESVNPVHLARRAELRSEIVRLGVAQRQAMEKEPALAQQFAKQLEAVRDQLAYVEQDIDGLTMRAPLKGAWIAPQDELLPGNYAKRGTQLGMICDMDRLMVRATATQNVSARIVQERPDGAEIRVRGRPSQLLSGRIESVLPAGQEQLPSRSLGFTAGGSMETDPHDTRGEKAREPFFEIRVNLDEGAQVLPGQRVVVRFRLPNRPLAAQAWHELLQVLQRRFRV